MYFAHLSHAPQPRIIVDPGFDQFHRWRLQSPPMNMPPRNLLAVLLVASLVHAATLAAVHIKTGAIDTYAFQSIDSREYYAIAANLIDHAAFSQDATTPLHPDTWRTPGYPLFLAGLMSVLGKSPGVLIIAQQFLGIASAVLVFAIAGRWLSPRRAAVVTILFLLEPYHLYYSLWLMSTTLQTTLILAIGLALERAAKPLWLGLLCAALVLTWPGAVLVPVAVFAILVSRAWHLRQSQRLDAWIVPVRFAWICGLATSTWMLRNALVAGTFALSHQSGIVLAYFKTAEITLWNEGRTADRYLETSLDPRHDQGPHAVWDDMDRQLRVEMSAGDELNWRNLAQGNRTELDSFRLSSALTRIAIDAAFDSLWSTFACCVTRCGQILTFPLDVAIAPPNGVTVNRLRSALIGGVYAILAGGVLFRLIRYRGTLVGVGFPLLCTLALLLAATPQTDPRFRVPMIPMLLLLAFVPTRRATDDRPPGDPV